jgi:hypothetical protein
MSLILIAWLALNAVVLSVFLWKGLMRSRAFHDAASRRPALAKCNTKRTALTNGSRTQLLR